MSRELMIKELIKWNPHWNINTIKSWKQTQLLAIYNKELDKNKKVTYQQLSFLKEII